MSRKHMEAWLVAACDASVPETRIGTAFENVDGTWNLQLAAMPIGGGVVQLRPAGPKLGGVPVLPALPNQDVDVVGVTFHGGMPRGPLVSPLLRDDAIRKAWPAPTVRGDTLNDKGGGG